MLYPESNDLAKMNIATGGAAVGIFMVFLYFSIHISYGQNANNSSGLTRLDTLFNSWTKTLMLEI